MNRRLVLAMILPMVLLGTLCALFRTQRVEASSTIYIRDNGSIDPPTANISTSDNVTYVFTGNVNDTISVQRGNIVIDGAGHTLQGTGTGSGIYIYSKSNITIKNVHIRNFSYGFYIHVSSDNSISRNNITANELEGIYLEGSSNNNLTANNITNNGVNGIHLNSVSDNTITGNTVSSNNGTGIYLILSSNNTIYHNKFINNTFQASVGAGDMNTWDDGYPSGGNHWSDYAGIDVMSGPNQDQPGSDGFGDTPHVINANNTDHYPLVPMLQLDTTPPNITDVTQTPHADNVMPEDKVRVNATVIDDSSGVKQVSLNYTNGNGTWSFVDMTNLVGNVWNSTIPSFPNGTSVTYIIIAEDNMNNSITTEDMGYDYQYTVIPEFPSLFILPLFMLASFLAGAVYRRKRILSAS